MQTQSADIPTKNDMLLFKRVGDHRLDLPRRETEGAAGYDLSWADTRGTRLPTLINPGDQLLLETGWAARIPQGHVGLIRDRSGIALRGLTTRAGVIDSDYRGEIAVVLRNEGSTTMQIAPGARIAQLIVIPCFMGASVEVSDLDDTRRGDGGFGSTGS